MTFHSLLPASCIVAQVSNLLYRSASSLRRAGSSDALADWKSATQQVGNPRYEASENQRYFRSDLPGFYISGFQPVDGVPVKADFRLHSATQARTE